MSQDISEAWGFLFPNGLDFNRAGEVFSKMGDFFLERNISAKLSEVHSDISRSGLGRRPRLQPQPVGTIVHVAATVNEENKEQLESELVKFMAGLGATRVGKDRAFPAKIAFPPRDRNI